MAWKDFPQQRITPVRRVLGFEARCLGRRLGAKSATGWCFGGF